MTGRFPEQALGPVAGDRRAQPPSRHNSEAGLPDGIGGSDQHQEGVGPGPAFLPDPVKIRRPSESGLPPPGRTSPLLPYARRRGRQALSFQFHFLAHSRWTVS